MGWKTTWKRKNNIWCWNKEILLYLFCKYSWVFNIIAGFTKYCQFVLPYCQYMKKYKFLSLGGILHISAKLQGGICKTSCWLTEKFDGEGKLINVVQFQWGNWNFVNFRGVIDETHNFRRLIDYLLNKKLYHNVIKSCQK